MNDQSETTTLNYDHDRSRMNSNVSDEKITAVDVKQEVVCAHSKDSSDINTPKLDQSIDPENEFKGLKLILIHSAMCLCTFLIGLVRLHSIDVHLDSSRY